MSSCSHVMLISGRLWRMKSSNKFTACFLEKKLYAVLWPRLVYGFSGNNEPVREHRKISKSLTIQYDKMLYLIEDSELSRRANGKYFVLYHYPDGLKERHTRSAYTAPVAVRGDFWQESQSRTITFY